jgi:hypothetical protein
LDKYGTPSADQASKASLTQKEVIQMKIIIVCAFLLLPAASYALATAQEPDVIFYKGQKQSLYSNPLEAYYSDGRKRPNFMIAPDTIRTSNWRGYIATWEVKDNKLYLTDIDSWIDGRKATLEHLFGDKYQNGGIEATWFSGKLRIPDGKRLQYVHMGYGSVYERDIILTVEAGEITKTVTIDNTKRQLPSELELQRLELEKMKKEKQ